MIYFDNAATSLPKPQNVSKEICDAINTLGNPSRGGHSFALNASRKLYTCREKIARLFCLNNPLNVGFTKNSTESLNIAINSCFSKSDAVITTVYEHNSVIRPLYKLGCKVDIVGLDNQCLRYSEFENYITSETKGVIVNHASNVTGDLIDIKKISSICKEHGLILIIDASQSAGLIDINIEELGADILCFTGHKGLWGPQGTGGICLNSNITLEPFIVGGSGSNTFSREYPIDLPDISEAGTQNVHSICGLSAGIDFILETGINEIRKRELGLMWKFYNGIKDLDGIKIYGNFDTCERTPIVSLNIRDYDSQDIGHELEQKFGIAVRGGAHCAPLLHEALGTRYQGAVRFSFSYFNTDEEIEIGIDAIKSLSKLT